MLEISAETMMSPSEGTTTSRTRLLDIDVRSTGGLTLRGRWWHRENPRAVLLIAHGYGEHGACYKRVAESIAERADLDVIAVDFRGHGRSPGKRGLVRDYDDLTDDLLHTLEWAHQKFAGLDHFVLGHSNGGQVTLRACLRNPERIASWRGTLPGLPSKGN
jgi:alpha-beta hydrolase superfamily lysophospholipase